MVNMVVSYMDMAVKDLSTNVLALLNALLKDKTSDIGYKGNTLFAISLLSLIF